MALSYCSSFGNFNGQQDYFTQTQLHATEDELLCFNDNFNYFSSDHFINPFLEFDESLFSLPQHTFSKRQKTYPEDHRFFDAIPAQLPQSEAPAEGKKENGRGGSLSAQSIAARERRRKITDKTQELGKLIPGGNKMNTAEMLRSAFNYVKFLQAQVHVLHLMHRFCRPDQFQSDELHTLVGSQKIQQKLYSEEKCLVATDFLGSIMNHDEIQPEDPGLNDTIHDLLPGTNC